VASAAPVDPGPAIPQAAVATSRCQKCLSHGIYSAAAVLCGKALETLIKEKVGSNMIGKGVASSRPKE